MDNSITKNLERINLSIEKTAESFIKMIMSPLYFLISIVIVLLLAYFDPFTINQGVDNYFHSIFNYGFASFVINAAVGILAFMIATWNVVEE